MATTVSLAEKAYQELRNRIIYGDYLPGEVLSENALSKDLNMSRTPIRDALLRLSSTGFVVTLKNRGILVKDISYKELFDIQSLNHVLQIYATDLAISGAINFKTEDLKFHLDKQLAASYVDDYIKYVKHAILFGRAMIHSTNNQTMLDTYDSLRHKTMRMAIVNWKLNPEEKHYSANEINTKIFEAIIAKEYEKVKTILQGYTAYNRERFITNGRL